jgi:hypothetical protein
LKCCLSINDSSNHLSNQKRVKHAALKHPPYKVATLQAR